MISNEQNKLLFQIKDNTKQFCNLPFSKEKNSWIEQYCELKQTTIKDILSILSGMNQRLPTNILAAKTNFSSRNIEYFRKKLGIKYVNAYSNQQLDYFNSETYKPEDDIVSWSYFSDKLFLNQTHLHYAKKYFEKRNLSPNHLRILIEGLILGIPLTNLCKQISISYKQGRLLKKNLKLIDNRNKHYNNLTKTERNQKELDILNDIVRLRSSRYIKNKYNVDFQATVNPILKKFGIVISEKFAKKVNESHLNENRDYPISPLLTEIHIGTLLGDSYLYAAKQLYKNSILHIDTYRKAKSFLLNLRKTPPYTSTLEIKTILPNFKNAYNVLQQATTSHLDIHMALAAKIWLENLENIFLKEGLPCKTNIRNSRDKHGNPVKTYEFTTPNFIQYFYLLKQWYPKGVKIVPRQIKLTPTTCLVWLYDDGCASSSRVYFNTQSFLMNDVDFLVQKLTQIGFYARRVKDTDLPADSNRKEPFWRIVLGRQRNIEKFFEYCKKGDPRLVKIMEKYYPHKFEV